jgi:hypothetical protein
MTTEHQPTANAAEIVVQNITPTKKRPAYKKPNGGAAGPKYRPRQVDTQMPNQWSGTGDKQDPIVLQDEATP